MDLVVRIKMNNAAFRDEETGERTLGFESARILRGLADFLEEEEIREDLSVGPLMDSNGNRCGTVDIL
jgi:hypothetical protein